MSIAKILDMLTGRTSEVQPQRQHDPLRLATAAILLDIAYADGTFTPAEDGNVTAFLVDRFALSVEDTQELLGAADELRRKMVDHFALTNYIRKELSSGETEIDADTSLAGVIDSTAIMELVVWIEGECGFDVEIDDITPDNFGSINKIVAYIDRNKKKS